MKTTGKKKILITGAGETERAELCRKLQNRASGVIQTAATVATVATVKEVKEVPADTLHIDLDDPFGNPGCIIMASGLGIRFGANKLMVPLKGRPLIQSILSTVRPLFPQSVVVTRHPSVEEYCRTQQQAVILHDQPHRSDTTRIGTQYLMDRAVDSITCFPGDQPFVSADTIMAFLLSAKNAPDRIIRLSYQGTDCAPVLFPSCLFAHLQKLPEGKGGSYLAKQHPDLVLRVEAADVIETRDIDTPADLEQFL